MNLSLPALMVRTLCDCPAYRISHHDSNYFAVILDGDHDPCGMTAVVEIFDVGGRTPPNLHAGAHEFFVVIQGSGSALVGGERRTIKTGDALLVRPGHEHLIENTGPGRLYCLTLLWPDEGFASLIQRGIPVTLDEQDRKVLSEWNPAELRTQVEPMTPSTR